MVFPVVMYGCGSLTIKKFEHQRIDAFALWCWRRLLRVPWTMRRSNQSILKGNTGLTKLVRKYSLCFSLFEDIVENCIIHSLKVWYNSIVNPCMPGAVLNINYWFNSFISYLLIQIVHFFLSEFWHIVNQGISPFHQIHGHRIVQSFPLIFTWPTLITLFLFLIVIYVLFFFLAHWICCSFTSFGFIYFLFWFTVINCIDFCSD